MGKSTLPLSLLSAIHIFFTLWNMLRTARALFDWQILVEYGAPAVYILSSGVFWSLAGIFLALKIIQGWHYSARAGIGISVLYWVWYWADRLLVQPSPAPNLVFSTVFSTVLLLIVILLWRLSDTQALFPKETE